MSERENVNKRVLSHSSLSWFKRSPAYFKWKVEHPEEVAETPALIFGNLFHTMVLEPDKVEERFFIFDQEQRPEKDKTMASKANKEWKALQVGLAKNRYLISQSDFNNAQNMQDAVMEKAGDFITSKGENEQHIQWRHDGQDFKGFIDRNCPDFMLDLKTAVDATPRQWQRKAYWDYSSHRQAAMYLDGDAKGMYTGDKEFYFIVVEKEPPYLVSINLVSKTKIAEGMTEYKDLAKRIKACRKSGQWIDFDPVINVWE
jgi:hypothetical protein